MHVQVKNKLTSNTKVGLVIEAIQDDGLGNLDCHCKVRVYWIGTEILPSNKPPKDPSNSSLTMSTPIQYSKLKGHRHDKMCHNLKKEKKFISIM